MNETAIEKKRPEYDPAWDATRMTEAMGLVFDGVAISLTPDEATITIRYKKPAVQQ